MTMPFDTLKYARELEAAGVPWEQAQSQSNLLAHALSRRMACSEHLAHVSSNLGNKLESTTLRLENKLESTTLRLENKLESTTLRLENKLESTTLRLENKLESSALKLENAFIPLFNSLNVLKWMYGVSLGLTIAIFLKLLFH